MATMKDVATLAAVSVSSVSHVLNGTRYVSPAIQQRIETAMHQLDYVPSAVARSLRHKTTRTLGIMIPNSGNPYFAELIRTIEDHCFASGYNVVLCNSDDQLEKQNIYLQVLMEKRVDGLIIMSSGDSQELQQRLAHLGLPLVLVDRECGNNLCDVVTTDDCLGGYMATRHLIEQGHRQIACISGPPQLAPSQQRTKGWLQALHQAGFAPGPLITSDFTGHGGYQAACQLLENGNPPQAIFACNDLMAIGVLCRAQQLGLCIPEHLSVVGFDDIELSAYTSPPLSTVAQPKEQLGAIATKILFERINQQRTEPCRITLKPELRVRASTGKAPALSSGVTL